MGDKDRLEKIKKIVKDNHVFVRPVDYLWKNEKYFDVEVGWLIEQAEKVVQLKEENKKLLEYAIDTRDGVEYWNSKYRESERKIEMAIEKIDELPFSTRLEIDEITKILKGKSE